MPITVEEAVRMVEEHTPVLEEEWVPLLDGTGRILTQELRANIQNPPFDRAAQDGYAVRSDDLRGAEPNAPVRLRVIEHIYAGHPCCRRIERGQAARIMTGGMIPAGADAVVRQEDTDYGESVVQIFRSISPDENYCHRGEEYRINDVLLPVGSKLDASSIAVAAGAGVAQLAVRRRLKAALVSTGDEVCPPGGQLERGKIYDTNSAYLAVRLQQLGVDVLPVCFAGDDLEEIAQTLLSLRGKVDLILTTGGVSVGQKDLLRAAVEQAGGNVVFHGISMKPGMPTLFATLGQTLLLGLSGNPFAAAVPFELLIRPILSRALRDPTLLLKVETAVATTAFRKKKPGPRRFLRAKAEHGTVHMPQEHSNGQMRSMIGCNCLIDLPAGCREIQPGDVVKIWRFGGENASNR